MCGNVGIAGNLVYWDEALFRRLLVFDYFRGPDSTGMASYRKNGDVFIAKAATHPLNLFDMRRFVTANSGSASAVLLGHNRAATKGKVNDVNAHPYYYGKIVGAHNGTLEKTSWDALNKILGYETDVDSQAVIACIDKVGIEETVKVMRGAWALVWFDTEAHTLNFLRNDERDLWWAMNKSLNKLFWASEYRMMGLALDNCKESEKQELYKDKDDIAYRMFKKDHLYSVHLPDLVKGFDTLPDFVVKKLEGAGGTIVPFSTTTTTYSGGGHSHNHYHHHNHQNQNNKSDSAPVTKLEIPGYPDDPFGDDRYLEGYDISTMAEYGCSWCRDAIDITKPGLTVYPHRDVVLCQKCGTAKDDQTKLYVTRILEKA